MSRPVVTMLRVAVNGSGLDPALDEEMAGALRAQGAQPFRVPFDAPPNLDGADALVLMGGEDIDPASYGARRHANHVPLEPGREAFDFALLDLALATKIPILGICLGAQELWVKKGGALIQDIESECESHVDHRTRSAGTLIDLSPGSRLAQAFGKERVLAYCNHHQSFANDPAPSDLVVTARSPDGLIEGFEMAGGDRFVVAVVWHPERPPLGLELFSALVRAAREHANEPESDPAR